MRATYIDLRPAGPAAVVEEGATGWVWASAAVAIAAVAIAVALTRRRPKAMEDA